MCAPDGIFFSPAARNSLLNYMTEWLGPGKVADGILMILQVKLSSDFGVELDELKVVLLRSWDFGGSESSEISK